ncbi:NAD(P)(+) transhydrogenase (Re/Si-specific) subunit beta [Alkalilimnicola sp. S0819]|uniref:NAD(P)(+) transhydrogenase (Re/Si-specific) subunit beta n=1 Tax=Alkalilimnicola sp. S0819 TaxID=2613922 RepID=UPI001262837E|nr:NAD(P)(+) transhydrogenase (Re/Si-specific) subunit beta [Alkalilimnicola sp. S0819]KAB7624032.1 NAD(P)(+) transhydrogenase (Re/Si-specific) subunit beta [Alkalilimnicola sp. S0819]MPQ16597.1 NAD(P)(+) transhydrogenase (Re/Si-specific) subunit beta [Alkalilimnicola sp. S0819]
MNFIVQISYFLAAVLFILGLKGMTSPKTARQGIVWAGWGMVLATAITFIHPTLLHSDGIALNYVLIVAGIAIGGGWAWMSGKKVAMTDMPQMVALYNGMGGGAAAAIAAVELMKASKVLVDGELIWQNMKLDHAILGLLGALIGTVAFSGSLVAWAKLDGRMKRNKVVPQQQLVNIIVFVATIAAGLWAFFAGSEQAMTAIVLFFVLALVLGAFIAIPIGGADMPVVISLFNALTGLAVGFEGYVLGNPAMIIAGTVVGAAGTLLTQLMAKAMNRPISNVLFSGFGTTAGPAAEGPEGEMKEAQAEDVGIMMAYAEQVVIVPGYGMAVAQAQHKIWELVELLQDKGVTVKFAIHPVAGRMPGHMNVLLAEAGVPYDLIYDMEDINAEFSKTTVSLVIGANDVVNPAAKDDPSSPIYGMPILNVMESQNTIVIKRGRGTGFSGVENGLFFADNTRMLFGDAQKMAGELIQTVKQF